MTRVRAAVALMLVAGALAACGESPEDQARDDGEDVGAAVRAVADSTSVAEARDNIAKLRDAVKGIDTDTADKVRSQLETQRDTISSTVESVSQAGSFDEAKTAVQGAAQDLRAQADAFRNSSSSIANEFWRGFEDGYDGD